MSKLEEAYRNREILEEGLKEIGTKRHNPEVSTYKTWYRLPLKLEPVENGVFIQQYMLRKLRIPSGKKDKEQLLGEFFHEVGHLELLPFDVPFMTVLGKYLVDNCPKVSNSGNPYIDVVLNSLTPTGVLILYFIPVREATAELYTMLKMGYKRWREMWRNF